MEKEMNRRIVITNTETKEKWEMPFDTNELRDSEALRIMLSFVDPGSEYTVKFTNKHVTPISAYL